MGNSSEKNFDSSLLKKEFFQHLKVALKEGILEITLSRPEKRHAIDRIMANELVYCFDLVREYSEIRVVLIRSSGPVFCAGADLLDLQNREFTPTTGIPLAGDLNDLPIKMREACKPIVVAVQGKAMAGALLVICNATHVLASEQAEFSAPEIKRGLWPFMVMAGLLRVMPRRQAIDFIMRAKVIDARHANQLGLTTELATAADLEIRAEGLANELAQLAPVAMRFGLEACYHQELMDFEEAISYLKKMLDKTLVTNDAKEGIAAFKEKRSPIWTNS